MEKLELSAEFRTLKICAEECVTVFFRHRAVKLPDQPRTFSGRRTSFAFKAGSAFWCNSV
jgi:hypothetical protein